MTGRLITGDVVSFDAAPRHYGDSVAPRHIAGGAVVVGADGRIAWVGEARALPGEHAGLPRDDWTGAVILPGFVDAHIHFPQVRMLAAPGLDLLDWLNRFTFPEEARYGDPAWAAARADEFLGHLFRHGTTSALAFSSVHKCAAEALFAAADRRGMALTTGKTMMDRNARPDVEDDAETSGIESAELIAAWHGRGRLSYAITPRFAVTSSEAQLQVAGDLAKDHPGLVMQTHLSESHREIETVARLFPAARDYTDVYDRFGLLGPRSLFAHGIHLSERECARLAEAGSAVVHCPTSNTFLGSGLFDIAHVASPTRPVAVGVATDIAGGTSYSMLATLAEAYKVAMLRGRRFTASDAFALATRGNADLVGLDSTGSLAAGNWADIVVLDPRATPVLAARDALSDSLEDRLFALMMLGDDRAVKATYVAGACVHRREDM
jgi:guanine deaminase